MSTTTITRTVRETKNAGDWVAIAWAVLAIVVSLMALALWTSLFFGSGGPAGATITDPRLISIVLRFSGLVLAEAVLCYIGVGVGPETASWGTMINHARSEFGREPMVWWSLAAAFVAMFGLVLPANLFGDARRDALDPSLRVRGQGE